MLVPLIYTGTIMPYELAFHDFRIGEPIANAEFKLFHFAVRVAIDLAFLTDLIVSFFAGFYNLYGEPVVDLRTIRWHYTRTFFFFDLIACIPPEAISMVAESDTEANPERYL